MKNNIGELGSRFEKLMMSIDIPNGVELRTYDGNNFYRLMAFKSLGVEVVDDDDWFYCPQVKDTLIVDFLFNDKVDGQHGIPGKVTYYAAKGGGWFHECKARYQGEIPDEHYHQFSKLLSYLEQMMNVDG